MSNTVTGKSVFIADSPEVLAAFKDGVRAADEYAAEVNALRREFPGYEVMSTRSFGRTEVVGLSGPGAPSELWRKSRFVYVPLCKTKEGRALYERVMRIHCAHPKLPGISTGFLHGLSWCQGGLHQFGERIVVEHGVDAEIVRKQSGFDPKVWKQIKMSEFYELIEENEKVVPKRRAKDSQPA